MSPRWAGTDDGDLDDQIVKALGLETRQGRHLGAALHLEDAMVSARLSMA